MSTNRTVVTTSLNDLVDHWRTRYGTPVARFDVSRDGRHVTGVVLTRGQAGEVAARLVDGGVSVNLVILEDRAEAPPGGWLRAADEPVAVFRAPDLGRLSTELLPGDGPVRALDREGAALLVQTDDDTLGWADAGALCSADAPAEPDTSAVLGDGARLEATSDAVGALWAAARPFVDARTPYILGGRSGARIDCSGLMSIVHRQALGAVLPRHSMDQRRLGTRVGRSDARPGDLLFARLGDTNIPHVGLLLAGDAGLDVVHASQRAGHVVRQPLAELLEGYRFMAVRRLLREPQHA